METYTPAQAMDLKVIMADIDGTLVNEARDMTPMTLDVLKILHDQGILFGIASGRPLDELQVNAKKWGMPFECDFLIGMNGAEVWDEALQKQSQFNLLSRESIQEIMELMAPFDNANPFIYSHGRLLSKRFDELMAGSMKRSGKECQVMQDISEIWQEENAKVMFRVWTPEEMPPILEYINAHPSPHYRAFITQPTMVEFMDPAIHKGVAVEAICKDHDFGLENIAAFGDTSNDNEMLEICGLGVCLINGTDDTKAAADVITEYDNDHDGLARCLIKTFPQYFTGTPYETVAE